MISLPVFAAVALLALPPAAPAAAWGAEGHRIVCEIAWLRLDDRARAMVRSVRRGERVSFADSCLWADEVRSTTHRYTYSYHFINIPARSAGVDMKRDCGDPEKRCAPWAIKQYATILADRSRNRADRAEALKFLAHFVGDLHQPLHAGRPGDLGGNRVVVDFFGDRGTADRPNSLHRVWDTSILERAGIAGPHTARALNQEIRPEESTRWSGFDVLGWTNESYRIAEELGYRLPSGNRIGEEYYRDAVRVSRERLKQAGVRLAFLINAAAAGKMDFRF